MNKWKIIYHKKAKEDFERLDGSQRIKVIKAINKVSYNPLPISEGGYGKPLGNRNNIDLNGCLKIKLKAEGIRVVYQIVRKENEMIVIIIGIREDNYVYKEAYKRLLGR